jgi:hypothetical protein
MVQPPRWWKALFCIFPVIMSRFALLLQQQMRVDLGEAVGLDLGEVVGLDLVEVGRPVSMNHSVPHTRRNSHSGSRPSIASVRRSEPPTAWLACALIAARLARACSRTSI